MLSGGIYDAIFGGMLLIAPEFSGQIMSIPCPDDTVYIRFIGVFLFILTFGYIVAWRDIENNMGIVYMMIFSRTSGFLFLFLYAFIGNQPEAFFFLATGDLFWAIVHSVFRIKKF